MNNYEYDQIWKYADKLEKGGAYSLPDLDKT
jgi:hypothetical protein